MIQSRLLPLFVAVFTASLNTACGKKDGTDQTTTPFPAACSSADVYRVKVPYYYDQPNSPTFDYAFQVKLSGSPGMPLVIILGGGPGQTLIGADSPEGAVPSSYNLILTDPRGEGCNASAGQPFPVEFFKTEYLARDVLSIIKALDLKDYILYGASYGTVHATVTASIAQREGFSPPKAVVLEGVVGRAFIGGIDEYFQTFVTEWTRVKGLLDPGVVTMLSTSPLPLEYSSKQWKTFIARMLIAGEIPGLGHPLPLLLDPLLSSDPATVTAARATLDQAIQTTLAHEPKALSMLAPAIFCRELAQRFERGGDWDFVDGNFVLSNQDVCLSVNVPYTPYDSADWPITAPIYYFQGPYDPTVSLDNANHHFIVQTGSRRNFVLVSGASHAPLTRSLQARGCTTAVWDAIAFDPGTLLGALELCDWPFVLTPADPVP